MQEPQLDPLPKSLDFSGAARSHYQGKAGRAYHEAKFAVPEMGFSWIARARAAKFSPHLSASDAVLEFGVGPGWNLAALRCRERIGVDIGDHLAATVRAQGITFLKESKSLKAGIATVVICHHVLEHVAHPAETLAELRRLLVPGGRLLLLVPYETERRHRHYLVDEPNHHLYAWNPQTLGNLVADCGFAVVSARIGRYGYDRIAAVLAARFRLGEPGFRMLRGAAQLIRPAREVRIVAIAPGPS